MKIKPSELHHSRAILEEFDDLREQLLILFSIDKFINKKQKEEGVIKENRKELDTIKMVYEKSMAHQQAVFD